MSYYRARYYATELGRFISEDPIGLNGGLNLYAYANGDPVSNTDPTGEIVPAAVAYGRCVAQCVALDSLGSQLPAGDCFDLGGSAAGCALGCLNPLNWFKFDGILDIYKRIPTKTVRRNWEKYFKKNWPNDPATRSPKVAHHRNPLADGGSNHPRNIQPMTRQQHVNHHRNQGDPGRWAKRRGQ